MGRERLRQYLEAKANGGRLTTGAPRYRPRVQYPPVPVVNRRPVAIVLGLMRENAKISQRRLEEAKRRKAERETTE